ncbi:hypothetical protein ISG10_38270, partial [Burkholderia pseudomallei]|nr:hypothetical protein [Burkholderia pseudomallei]MBF3605626.1 hypothetical protein [Burkholderia pseudomallei]
RSSAYVSSSLLNYWDGRGRDIQFQAGFSSVFKRVSYTGDSNFASLGVYGTYRSPFGTYSGNASVDNRARQAS